MLSECCNEKIIAMKKGNQVRLYCSKCGMWMWTNKKKRKLIGLGEIELREEVKL